MMTMRNFTLASANDPMILRDNDSEIRIHLTDDGLVKKEEIADSFRRFEGKYLALAWPISVTKSGHIQYAVDIRPSPDLDGVAEAHLCPLKVLRVEVSPTS